MGILSGIALAAGVLILAVTVRVAMVAPGVARRLRQQRGEAHRLDHENLCRVLSSLLLQAYDGGWIIFNDPAARRFVQFRKYVHDDGTIGLESAFPKADWSIPYYLEVQELLKSICIPFSRVAQREENSPEEYVLATFGEDVQSAAKFVERTFRDVFKSSSGSFQTEGDAISFSSKTIRQRGIPTMRDQIQEIRDQLRVRRSKSRQR